MTRKPYPSDITRAQFERIKYLLEQGVKATKPLELDLYDIFCAVLYVVKEGCTWRASTRLPQMACCVLPFSYVEKEKHI